MFCGAILFSIPKWGGICYVGRSSLELYLTHYLFLNLIRIESIPSCESSAGILLIIVNYIIAVFFTLLTSRLLSNNRVIRFLLYGRH